MEGDSSLQQQADILKQVAPHLSDRPQAPAKKYHGSDKYGPDESDFLHDGQNAGVNLDEWEMLETALPPPLKCLTSSQLGFWRGIQGNSNSCYIDATLMAMFAFEEIFDHLIQSKLRVKEDNGSYDHAKSLQILLREDIVKNLRTRVYVDRKRMNCWRRVLDFWLPGNDVAAGDTKEREVSELLDILFDLFGAPTYINTIIDHGIRQGTRILELLIEPPSKSLLGDKEAALAVFPTVQELLEGSFREANIHLVDIPSCLILQMPRENGSKAFPRIFPSFILRVGHLLEDESQLADSWIFAPDEKKSAEMELFAVITIHTDHFISFMCGDSKHWYNFDSMADHIDGESVPQLDHIPRLTNYLNHPDDRLSVDYAIESEASINRLVDDCYICFYRRRKT